MSPRWRPPARPRPRHRVKLLAASLGALSVAALAALPDAASASTLPAPPVSCEAGGEAPARAAERRRFRPPADLPDPVCAAAETPAGRPADVLLTYPLAVAPVAASLCTGLDASGSEDGFAAVHAGPSAETVRLMLAPGASMPAAVRCPSHTASAGAVTLGVLAPAPVPGPAAPTVATPVQKTAGADAIGAENLLGPLSPQIQSWGENAHLELGAGYRSDFEERPVPMRGLAPGIVEVAAGEGADAALTATGEVETWGGCLYGQCGIGQATGHPLSTPTVVLSGVRQIAAGGADVVALMDDGTVDVWGANMAGEAGNGTSSNGLEGKGDAIPAPQPVPGLTGVTHVYGGGSIFAVRADGSVVAWGRNHHGELGLGFTSFQVLTPTVVPKLHAPVQIAVGNEATFEDHTLALTATGQVLATGSNDLGQNGNGTTASTATFAPVPGLPPVAEVSAGGRSSLVRTADGHAYSWGSNRSGELGIGNTTGPEKCSMSGRELRSRLVACSTRPILLALTSVSEVGLGLGYGGAVTGGRLAEWGDGTQGALGNGSQTDELKPTLVSGLGGVSKAAFGTHHAITFGTLEPQQAPWLTATAQTESISLAWSGTAAAPWILTWREATPGSIRAGESALPASAHGFKITGLKPGHWEVSVNTRFGWPHPRVAVVTVP